MTMTNFQLVGRSSGVVSPAITTSDSDTYVVLISTIALSGLTFPGSFDNPDPHVVGSFAANTSAAVREITDDVFSIGNGTYYIYWCRIEDTVFFSYGTITYTQSITALTAQTGIKGYPQLVSNPVILSSSVGYVIEVRVSSYLPQLSDSSGQTLVAPIGQLLYFSSDGTNFINNSPISILANGSISLKLTNAKTLGAIYSFSLFAFDVNGLYQKTFTLSVTAATAVDNLELNLNRTANGIRAENVLVVSRTDQANSAALAASYVAKRTANKQIVPSSNIVAITPTFGMVLSVTCAQVIDFLQKIVAAIAIANAAGHAIRCILLCGDFPSDISDADDAYNQGISFPGLLKCPKFWLANSAGNFFRSGVNETTYVNPRFACPVTLNTPSNRIVGQGIDPYFTPSSVDIDAYAIFILPLSPLSDGLVIAQQRIDDAIAAEHKGYTDWGTVLLAHSGVGGFGNSGSTPFLQEARFALGNATPPNFYWDALDAEFTNGAAASGYSIAAHGHNGWETWQPGVSFTDKPANVGFRAPGVYSYYGNPYFVVEQPGDFNYRLGAIAVFSQSYGFRPTAVDFIDATQIPTLVAHAANPGEMNNGAVIYMYAASLRGTNTTFVGISYTGPNGATATIECSGSPKVYIGKIGLTTKFSVATSGLTLEQIKANLYTAMANASTGGDVWHFDVANAPGQMSRALAAFRAGCVMAAGVCREPAADRDLDTYALFTTFWAGGNAAEWVWRAYGQQNSNPDTTSQNFGTTGNRGWYALGDPLFCLFKQSHTPGAVRLF